MIKLNTSLLAIIVITILLCLPNSFIHAQNADSQPERTHCELCYESCYSVWPNDRKKCKDSCERFCSAPQSDLTKSVTIPPEDPCVACMWACKQKQPLNMPLPGDRDCMEECFRSACSD